VVVAKNIVSYSYMLQSTVAMCYRGGLVTSGEPDLILYFRCDTIVGSFLYEELVIRRLMSEVTHS